MVDQPISMRRLPEVCSRHWASGLGTALDQAERPSYSSLSPLAKASDVLAFVLDRGR
ncbi:hypothetical protein GGH92_008475 [Coemansia sp. RSA 2673]|nr:hypothetical protein GGH92_008475 [Coemansia sp. RSA 2673]